MSTGLPEIGTTCDTRYPAAFAFDRGRRPAYGARVMSAGKDFPVGPPGGESGGALSAKKLGGSMARRIILNVLFCLAWLGCVVAVGGFLGGCHSPPFHKLPVQYGSVPFGFGTNASVEITAALRNGGHYRLYFLLQDEGLPHDEVGRVPSLLAAPVHVLVLINGQPALDEQFRTLSFGGRTKGRTWYSLAGFSTSPKTRGKR